MGKLQIRMTKQKRKEIQEKLKASKKEIVKVKVVNGRKQVTGGKHLKETQQYPKAFGARVSKLHSSWVDTWQAFLSRSLQLCTPIQYSPGPNSLRGMLVHVWL